MVSILNVGEGRPLNKDMGPRDAEKQLISLESLPSLIQRGARWIFAPAQHLNTVLVAGCDHFRYPWFENVAARRRAIVCQRKVGAHPKRSGPGVVAKAEDV